MLPIFTYHAIGEHPSPVSTPVSVFEQHLNALAKAGYSAVTVADALAFLRGEKIPASKPILITFDDGYESVYTRAWDRLRDYGFTATIFLITDRVGGDNRWLGQHESIPPSPLLTWTQIEHMAAQGADFAAHTRTHPPLTLLSPARAESEIVESAYTVRERTGCDACLFCYPYGAADATIRAIAAQHFDGAVGTRLGTASRRDDPFMLPRLDSYYLSPPILAHLEFPTTQVYWNVRDLLRRVKRLIQPDFDASLPYNR